MGRKRFQPEQIISKLREAEVLLAKGDTVGGVVHKLGAGEQTYYRWRRECWGSDSGPCEVFGQIGSSDSAGERSYGLPYQDDR